MGGNYGTKPTCVGSKSVTDGQLGVLVPATFTTRKCRYFNSPSKVQRGRSSGLDRGSLVNIVVMTEFFKTGGLETQLMGYVRQAHHRGHRVSFVVGQESRIEPLQALVGDRLLRSSMQPDIRAANAIDVVSRIAEFCTDQQCDFLHLHPFVTLPLGALVASRLRVPFVVTLHGIFNVDWVYGTPYGFLLEQMVFRDASKVFCTSAWTIPAVLDAQPAARCAHLPNAVDLALFFPSKANREGAWAVIARLDEAKVQGIKHFLDTWFDLFEKTNVHVFGDGPARQGLAEWLAQESYTSSVRLCGHCDTLNVVLRGGYAGVAGMGRVVLEGGALELPVILVGYDGVKGLMRMTEMDALSQRGFSGLGSRTIASNELGAQVDDLRNDPTPYNLRPWVEKNADEVVVWQRYFHEVENLAMPRFNWQDAIFELLEQKPTYPLFSSELLKELIEDKPGYHKYMLLAERTQSVQSLEARMTEQERPREQLAVQLSAVYNSKPWKLGTVYRSILSRMSAIGHRRAH